MLWSSLGGSAFGLDAAGGVMKKLEEVGVGRGCHGDGGSQCLCRGSL